MNLVFTDSPKIGEKPFTTSEVIAEYSNNQHATVQRLIRKYNSDLEEFGKVGFTIRVMPSGQKAKIYHLNEEQATLLITYLDNTEQVRAFKKVLVSQFYEMKTELIKRGIYRESGKEIRHELTDAIKFMKLSGHYYKIYTDLAYKSALGFTAKQLRTAREVEGKCSPLDYLSATELSAVNKRSSQLATLILLGMAYEEIKERIGGLKIIYQTTLKLREGV